jgi:hypothetical protein
MRNATGTGSIFQPVFALDEPEFHPASRHLVHIQDSNGEDILTFVPRKNIQSLSFSSPLLEEGETYTIFYGGSSTGTVVDGLYQGGSYSGGTQLASFKVSDIVTRLGSGGSWGGRP